jgi:hypothetical protein
MTYMCSLVRSVVFVSFKLTNPTLRTTVPEMLGCRKCYRENEFKQLKCYTTRGKRGSLTIGVLRSSFHILAVQSPTVRKFFGNCGWRCSA